MYHDIADTSVTNPYRIETRNTSSINTYSVSAIKITNEGTGYTGNPTFAFNAAGSESPTPTAPVITLNIPSSGGDSGKIKGVSFTSFGKGYKVPPTITITAANAGAGAAATAAIFPIVLEDRTKIGGTNIGMLREVISDVDSTLSILITDISKYSVYDTKDTTIKISNTATDSSRTVALLSTDKRVVLKIVDSIMYPKLNTLYNKYDLVDDYVIYDTLNKQYYNILKITNEDANDFRIEINAVYRSEDNDNSSVETKLFLNHDKNPLATIPTTSASQEISPSTGDFLQIMRKDTIAYKSEYIYNREDVIKLNENIGVNKSRVEYQNSLYEAQHTKNVFLERQILIYNIIIGIIILVLVVINVVKIENQQLIKTISMSCLGIILLLFVIYFISNITYIETFTSIASSDVLSDLASREIGGKRLDQSNHNIRKVTILKNELEKLNKKFISYFEKLIITLPSTDNLDFYKEIKEGVINDRDNKRFINSTLEYNKYQGSNNLNSLKYDLENNKLYINTILISAIIFIGIYNLYINYINDDKYLALFIFICVLIFIVIVSYYIITMNRRVKTVFKNIYWGPESSERF
jgi:uncharacterized integral membrane protein